MRNSEYPNLELLEYKFFKALENELKEIKCQYPEFELIRLFPQTWGDTSLGFGGIGGQAITTAYTSVFECLNTNHFAVFFGNRLAYVLDNPNREFIEDVKNGFVESVHKKIKYKRDKYD